MPRIKAPTVAEHHIRQRQALLDAAREILATEGLPAVTPAAVGQRAGLARSSVYQYFGSSAEIVACVVEEAFPPANTVLAQAMAGLEDPLERIDVYISTTLRLGAEGAHRVASALASADLPSPCRLRLMELHREQAQPLWLAVKDLGVPDPELTASLLGGLVQAALRQIEMGNPFQFVTPRTLEMVHHGLGR